MSYFLASGNSNNFSLSVEGVDVTDFITSWQMSSETDTYDVSTFGSGATQTISGQSWTTVTVTATWPADYEEPYWAHEEGI